MSYQPPPLPSLVMRRGPHLDRLFYLNKNVVTVGRDQDNDIIVEDAEVSRHHARLTLQGNNWVLEDLGSRNGTFVNGQRLTGPLWLGPGSQIGLGASVLFTLEAGPPVASWVAPQPPAPPARLAARSTGFPWILVVGLAVGTVTLLGFVGALAYFYLNKPAIQPLAIAPASPVTGSPSPAVTPSSAVVISSSPGSARGPDVAFYEPAPGTHVDLGASLLVFATASDENKVTRLDLWIDDQLVGQQDRLEPQGTNSLSLAQTLVAASPGTHALSVRAYNGLGTMGESPVIYVTVSDQPTQGSASALYVIQPGDTLQGVASKLGVSVADLQKENRGIGDGFELPRLVALPWPGPGPFQPPQPGGPQVMQGAPGQPSPSFSPIGKLDGFVGPVSGEMAGLVPVGIGALSNVNGMAQIDSGMGWLDPPNGAIKPPFLKEPKAADCSVELNWENRSTEKLKLKLLRLRVPMDIVAQEIDITGDLNTYRDKVPYPDNYAYIIKAEKSSGNQTIQGQSNRRTITVPPSAACIGPREMYKQIFFKPTKLALKPSTYGFAALWLGLSEQGSWNMLRMPRMQGGFLPTSAGSYLYEQQTLPAPASLYLNPDDPVWLALSATGVPTPGERPDHMGLANKPHPFKDLTDSQRYLRDWKANATYGSRSFDLTYHVWLDDVKWVAEETSPALPPPTNLRLAKTTEDLKNKRVSNCYSCDPTTTRVLLWDPPKVSLPEMLVSYILYRGYSCPGQDAQIKAPLVMGDFSNQNQPPVGINLSPKTEPVGCVASYQVSAYGPTGESAPSNTLSLSTLPAMARVLVTFKDLTVSKQTVTSVSIYANEYYRSTDNIVMTPTVQLALDSVPFDHTIGGNTFLLHLDADESLRLRLRTGDYCDVETNLNPPPQGWKTLESKSFPLSSKTASGACQVTIQVKPGGELSAGQTARKTTDLSVSGVRFIGRDVYADISEENMSGPDKAPLAQIELESYWYLPALSSQSGKVELLSFPATVTRWWVPDLERHTFKVNTIMLSDNLFVNLDKAEFFVRIKPPRDFDDAKSDNNSWSGRVGPAK